MICEICQTIAPDGTAICGACVQTEEGAGGELRLATVVRFLVPNLEDADDLIRTNIRTVISTVFTEHGGVVVESDDGAEGLAVFLDRTADEDAVTKAMVSCSEAAGILRDDPAERWESVANVLELRAGIATGAMIVDADGAPTPEARGLPAALAARLKTAAGPDEVLVDEMTARSAAADIPLDKIAPLRVGGISLPAWRLDVRSLPRRVYTGRLLSQRSEAAPVGRDHELAVAQACFGIAMDEQRLQRVAIIGGRGSGRGRFIIETARRVRAAWTEASSARATIHGRDELAVPFELRRELVTSLLGLSGDSDIEQEQLTESLDALSEFEPTLADRFVRGRLAMITGLAGTDDETSTDPEHASEATFAAVAALMSAAAKRGGLIIGVHGLGNAREDHRRQLLRLLETLRDSPVVVLFATTEDHWPRSDWTLQEIGEHRVDLTPLAHQAGTHLLDQLLGHPDALDDATSRALVERAGGLPLVLEETLAALGDDGRLLHDSETGRWSVEPPESLDTLPRELNELLRWRLDRMPEDEQTALRHAAVVGPVFWRGLIADLGTQRAAAIFRRLEDRGFIKRLPGDSLPGEQAYGFTHAALRPLILSAHSEDHWSETHGRTARWLSTHVADQDMHWTGAIAWHFSRAGDLEQSTSYDMLAGRWARSVGDLGLAIEHFERAQRDAPSRDMQMEALLSRGEAMQLARRSPEAQPLLDEALAWAEEQGEPPQLLRCLLAKVYSANASVDLGAVEALVERALPIAETLGEGQARAQLLLNLSRAQLGHGKHDQSLESLATAMPLAAATSDQLTATRLAIHRGRLLMHMGRLAEAREALDAASEDALALHHSVLYELAMEGKAWVALAQGEVDEGAVLFEGGARVFGRLGSRRPALRCAIGLAHVESSRENFTEAANQAARSLELATEAGEPVMEAWALSSIAWIFGEVRRGKHKLKAAELTSAAIKVAKIDLGEHLSRAMAALDDMGGGPGLYRGHTALALAEQRADEAHEDARRAFEIAEAAVEGFSSGRLRIRLEQLAARLDT